MWHVDTWLCEVLSSYPLRQVPNEPILMNLNVRISDYAHAGAA